MRVAFIVPGANAYFHGATSRRLIAAREARVLGEQAVVAVQARVGAAFISPIELNKVRTALAQLRIKEEHADHELAAFPQQPRRSNPAVIPLMARRSLSQAAAIR